MDYTVLCIALIAFPINFPLHCVWAGRVVYYSLNTSRPVACFDLWPNQDTINAIYGWMQKIE